MIKLRTFATPIKIFATMRELHDLDAQVQAFLQEEGADKVYSVSDSTTVGDNGETIGLMRAVAYRVPDCTLEHDRAAEARHRHGPRGGAPLEREAVVRYVDHPAASDDPRLVSYWESLRRNEAQHRESLEAWMRGHGADPDADAPARADLTAAALDPDATGRHPLAAVDAVRGRAGDSPLSTPTTTSRTRPSSSTATSPTGRRTRELMELFKELARSESGHRNGLRRVIGSLQETATPVVLFCPLCGWELDFGRVPSEGAEVKCRMCPGRFALRLDEGGDWTLERLAP